MSRIIYYYQTFTGLKKILEQNPICVTHIIVSSIHFGYDKTKPYIHLNDNVPSSDVFNSLWSDLKIAHNLGIKVMIMLGGAGGAYNVLFSNYNIFYNMLKDFIKSKPFISGIDLDIEESIHIKYVQCLINQIDKDFGQDFYISMAPLGSSLIYNNSGMGGFSYKDLYNTNEGKRINWFNGQFYGNYTFNSFNKVVNNNYPKMKVVMGMLASGLTNDEFNNIIIEIKKIIMKYEIFGGVYIWEYFDSPNKDNPADWAMLMRKLIPKKIKNKKIIPKKVIQKKKFYKRRKSRGFFSDLYQELVN